jgi:hypothetical protein
MGAPHLNDTVRKISFLSFRVFSSFLLWVSFSRRYFICKNGWYQSEGGINKCLTVDCPICESHETMAKKTEWAGMSGQKVHQGSVLRSKAWEPPCFLWLDNLNFEFWEGPRPSVNNNSEYTGDQARWITQTSGQNIIQSCIIETCAKKRIPRHTSFSKCIVLTICSSRSMKWYYDGHLERWQSLPRY